MSTLNIVEFPNYSLQDIPNMLRNIAQEIEEDGFGSVTGAVLVLNNYNLEIFGLGEADSMVAHYLLACAQRKLEAQKLCEAEQ